MINIVNVGANGASLNGSGFGARAGAPQPLPSTARITTKDQKVTYTWNQQLDEWYLNDGRGMEHGFTLKQRPDGNAAEPVLITLKVRGGLAAHTSNNGNAAYGFVVIVYLHDFVLLFELA